LEQITPSNAILDNQLNFKEYWAYYHKENMKNPPRKHEKSKFFKYMPATTAKLVLRNQTLRWSSPTQFNDPFDVPRELAFELTPTEIKQALSAVFIDLLEDPPKDTSELQPALAYIIQAAHAASSQELIDDLVSEIQNEGQIPVDTSAGLDGLRKMWKGIIPDLRILCLAAAHDRTSMWYHYADNYRGIVIELTCSDELDSPWLGAEPVQYPPVPPRLFSASGWAELMTLKQEIGLNRMLHALTYYKTPDWSYEEEWRVSGYKRPGEVAEYADYKIHPLNFSKVFFGPHISDEDRKDILDLLADDLNHVEAYQANIGFGRYFSFNPINIT
jgi:hypothetical protein